MELAGTLDGVLSGHGVGHVQQVAGLDGGLDRLELAHELVVDVQPAGGVHDERVEAQVARRCERAARARDRIQLPRRIVDAHVDLASEHRQLLDGGRPPHVGGHQEGIAPLLRQQPRQLCGGRRLAGALQAQHQHDPRLARRRRQTAWRLTEQGQQLVTDDAGDVLGRGQAHQHFVAHGLGPDAIDEGLDHAKVDVGFEQGEANLAKHGVDGLFGQARFAAEGLEDVLETGAE
jgi:hypothetical protein